MVKEHTANLSTVNLTFTYGQIVGIRRSFAVSQGGGGGGGFAVCLAHTAKALPCVAYGEEHTINSSTVNLTFTHGQIMGTQRSSP